MSQTESEVHIRRDLKNDQWRWVCPDGHANWHPAEGGIRCKTCRSPVPPLGKHWKELQNKATGEVVSCEQVVFE